MSILQSEKSAPLAEQRETSKYIRVLMAFFAAASMDIMAAERGEMNDMGMRHTSTASMETIRKVNAIVPEVTMLDIRPVRIPTSDSSITPVRPSFSHDLFLPKKGFQAKLELFLKTRCIDLGQIGEGKSGLRFKLAYSDCKKEK